MGLGRWFIRCDIQREVGKRSAGSGTLAMDGSFGCAFLD